MRKKLAITVLVTIIAVLIIEAVALAAFIYSGAYNISTYNHDNAVINRALDTGTTRAVIRHAKGIRVPPLTEPAKIQDGFQHYHEMCVACHGAPSVPPDEIARGLWPDAPDLAKAVPTWTPAQLFWVTKNGIKFTAMPAWGPTHTDNEIWAMVAFLVTLPHLSPAEYQQMRQKTQPHHQPGTPPEHQHAPEHQP